MMKKEVMLALVLSIFLMSFASADTYSCLSKPSGMVSWWRLNDNAFDDAGINNGTAVNNPAFVTGKFEKAVKFSGNNYIQMKDSNSLDLTKFSIEAWISINSMPSTREYIISKGEDSGTDKTNYGMFIQPVGSLLKIGCGFEDSYNFDYSFIADVGLQEVGKFVHVACALDSGSYSIYVNGRNANAVLYYRGVQKTVLSATPSPGNSPLIMGAMWTRSSTGGAMQGFLHGIIDEAAVYNRALTSNEIFSLFTAGINQTIMKLDKRENSTAGLWNSEMNNDICYNQIFGKDYTGSGPYPSSCNNPIIWLASESNSLASVNNIEGYNIPLCYSNLSCIARNEICEEGERIIVSLYQESASLVSFSDDGNAAVKICCKEGIETGVERAYWANQRGTEINSTNLSSYMNLIVNGKDLKNAEINYTIEEFSVSWRAVKSWLERAGFEEKAISSWTADRTGKFRFIARIAGNEIISNELTIEGIEIPFCKREFENSYWIEGTRIKKSLNDCRRENSLEKNCCPLGYYCEENSSSWVCIKQNIEINGCYDYKTREDCENFSKPIAVYDVEIKTEGGFCEPGISVYNGNEDGKDCYNVTGNCRCIWNSDNSSCNGVYSETKECTDGEVELIGNCIMSLGNVSACSGGFKTISWGAVWEGTGEKDENCVGSERRVKCSVQMNLISISGIIILVLAVVIFYYLKREKKRKKQR